MNILFVCTGNTCRSAMAAAIMDKLCGNNNADDIYIESAGLCAALGLDASDGAKEALKEYGIDLSYHRSKPITAELINDSDLILTMTKAQRDALKTAFGDKVYTLAEFAGETADITDPYGGDLAVYKKTAKQLYSMLEKVIKKLKDND